MPHTQATDEALCGDSRCGSVNTATFVVHLPFTVSRRSVHSRCLRQAICIAWSRAGTANHPWHHEAATLRPNMLWQSMSGHIAARAAVGPGRGGASRGAGGDYGWRGISDADMAGGGHRQDVPRLCRRRERPRVSGCARPQMGRYPEVLDGSDREPAYGALSTRYGAGHALCERPVRCCRTNPVPRLRDVLCPCTARFLVRSPGVNFRSPIV